MLTSWSTLTVLQRDEASAIWYQYGGLKNSTGGSEALITYYSEIPGLPIPIWNNLRIREGDESQYEIWRHYASMSCAGRAQSGRDG